MDSFEGKIGLDELARRWALHDGTIRSMSVRRTEEEGVVVEAICVPRRDSPVMECTLQFTGVSRFELQWSEDQEFLFVPGYKGVLQEDGRIYLSLDPYDDRDVEPDSRDGGVIEARSLRVQFTMKG